MRQANIVRKTAETDIVLNLVLDGSGKSKVDTGCGFLDHMLTLLPSTADLMWTSPARVIPMWMTTTP